jgi:hypothetical protein
MVQKAIDCCSRLNQWALAVDVAQEHGMQAENLLESRASHLRSHGRKIDEINLYKKAEEHHRSAQVLVNLAKQAVVRSCLHILFVHGLSYASKNRILCLQFGASLLLVPEDCQYFLAVRHCHMNHV